jgi:hypothetical protein
MESVVTATKHPVRERVYEPTLLSLSPEVLAHILSFLSVRDVLHLAVTCATLQQLCEAESIWKDLFKREFSNSYKTGWIHSIFGLSSSTELSISAKEGCWKDYFIARYVFRADCNL